MKTSLLFILAAAIPGALLAAPPESAVKAALVAETSSVQPGRPLQVAVQFEIRPHWHTYWKNGGDAGLATSIEWELPQGWEASAIRWPAPQRIVTGPLVSYGYENRVLHLVTLTPPGNLQSGTEVLLKARIDWLECEEVCVPGSADVGLRIPVLEATPAPSPQAGLFAEARRHLPAEPRAWNVRAVVRQGVSTLEITAPQGAPAPGPYDRIFFFPEDPAWMDNAAPQTARIEDGLILLPLALATNATLPERLRGVLSRGPGGFAPDGEHLDVDVPLDAAAAGADFAGGSASYAWILFLGLAGGLILNLMPCVFPVLGIKVMGLVRQAGQSRTRTRLHGLAFTLGVLASFWALAALLLALRSAGNELGWGFQLQEPGFVFLLTLFLFAFGLNMSGLFEFGASATRLGGAADSHSYGGSFFSGILATVVATPCAAPFLATALGAALTLPVLPSLGLFTAIGIGLSLPFLLLTLYPHLTDRLPKPGAWMLTLKQSLAFLLYATVAFLLWVLVGQVDEFHFLYTLLALVLVALAAWVYGRWQGPERRPSTRRLGLGAALLLTAAALLLGWPRSPDLTWESWSPERVAELRADDRPVYVDFTARWCATCQTNKLAVFGSREVRDAFRKQNVALLKADWTNRDPAITRELKKWDRAAVPFNLLYLPGRSEPVVLPEILTPQTVLEALAPGE